MHADKIGVKNKKKNNLSWWILKFLTWIFCFLKFTEGHLIIDHQKIYPRPKIKIDKKKTEKSYFNLATGWFLFSKYKTIKGLHWMMCVGSLTKKLDFQKIFPKTDISLISFQQLDLNRHERWNMRFDSRTRKIVKQEEHRLNLQNPWQEWHQHFSTLLEKLTTWGQYSGSWVGKQTIFRSAGGNQRWSNDESMHWGQ
jgi:hypothetical protein